MNNAYNEKMEELKVKRARAVGGLMTYVRAVLDAHEHGYAASDNVWAELRSWYDRHKNAQDAYLDHILERTTP